MDRRVTPTWQPVVDRTNPVDSDFISLADITAFLKQYARTIALWTLAALACAWFYIATTDRLYTAETQILIEPKVPQMLQPQQAEVNLTLDTAQIESQMAVMQSEKIASMVIKELKLADDPVFNQPHIPTFANRLAKLGQTFGLWDGGWLGWLFDGGGTTKAADSSALPEFERNRATMWAYRNGLDVRRVGVSYAINIAFESLDPDTAAKVANATAEAFVREQLETKAASARQGGEWLELRLNELRGQMNEATKIAQQFRSKHDYGVGGPRAAASDRQQSQDAEAAPTLEELEVTADTYRKMYESFLQAYTNSVSQQSYPVADARVITTATRPLVASAPRPKLMLAVGLLAGLIAGVGVAFLRHTFDRSLRSARQLRDEFGLECLGELPPQSGTEAYSALDEITLAPTSRYSNGLRYARTAIGITDSAYALRCIGIVSALPSDGKSAFAGNLAALYASSGARTLVIDADVYNQVLSTGLLPASSTADTAVRARGKGGVSQLVVPTTNGSFEILPSSVTEAKGLLASRNMRQVLSELQAYEIIIVDLPPLTSGADRLAVTPLLDGVILVAEWGKTPLDLFGELVRSMHASKTSIIGAVLTNVRVSSTKTYGSDPRRKAR